MEMVLYWFSWKVMNENVVECMECHEWKCSWLYEMHNYLDSYGLNWFQMYNEMDMGFGYGFWILIIKMDGDFLGIIKY